MSRKHPLKVSLSENIGPPTKRCRFIEPENVRLPPVFRARRRQDSLTSSADEDELGQPNYRIIRSSGGKRKKPNGSGPTRPVDENDITELTRRFKKARIRPVFFTISSFIEQTVDDVQITVGDDNNDESNSDTDETEVSSTFTFILPSSRNLNTRTEDSETNSD